MKKRILSIVLAVLMLVSVLPVPAMAAPMDPTGPQFEKTAAWADKDAGVAQITMKVKGDPSQTYTQMEPTAIVLVIDRSNSMGDDNKFKNAKTAAKKFVDKMLAGDNANYVQIAVVSYSGLATVNQSFSTNKNTIKSAITQIPLNDGYTENPGTNIQDGIHQAQQLLEQTNVTNKLMIVLTDGDPNCAYPNKPTGGIFIPSYDPNISVSDEDVNTYNINRNHFPRLYAKDIFKYDETADSGNNVEPKTVSEALFAKRAGTIIYAVGYEIQATSNAAKVMQSVASKGKYSAASSDGITGVFDDIANEITSYTAYNAVVTDPMGANFSVITDAAADYPILVDGRAPKEGEIEINGGKLTWNVAKKLDEQEHTLTFYIQYDTTKANGEAKLPTNNGAALRYTTDEAGNKPATPVNVANPELDNPAVKVSYNDGYTTDNSGLPNEPQYADKYYWPGKGATVAAEITRAGYVFNGWKAEGTTVTNGKFIAADEDITFTATWIEDESTVAYKITKEWAGRVGDSATFQIKRDGDDYWEVTLTADNATNNDKVWETTVNVPKWTEQTNAQGVKTESQYTVTETKINGTVLDANGKVNEVNQEDLVTGTWTSEPITNGAKNTYQAAPTYGVTYHYVGEEKPSDAVDLLPAPTTGLYANAKYTVAGLLKTEDAGKGDQSGTWSFDGWYFDEALENEALGTLEISGNVDLYGKWTFSADVCSVVYHLAVETPTGVTLDTETDTDIPYGALYTTNQPSQSTIEGTKDGKKGTWTFSGWFHSDAYYGNAVTSFNVTLPVEDLYGKWTFKAYDDIFTGGIDISKTLTSTRGTSPEDLTFRFEAYFVNSDKKRVTIGEEQIVFGELKKNAPETKHGSISLVLDEETLNELRESGGWFYVVERDDNEAGVTYDKTVYYGSIPVITTMALWAYNMPQNYNEEPLDFQLFDKDLNPVRVCEFENTYRKPDKEDVIKSGPQLNRDDHVAYIMGYPDGTVQPEGEITRAEACTIFFRLLTDSSRDYYFARTNDYSDVNAGDWFNNAISTLSNAGIVTGYNDGTFRPNQPITRGEMAKIIANFANLKYGGKTFTDLAGHWSKSYVELAAGNGWIAGYPDGSFRPDQKITRAETVTMINRVLDRVPAKESRLLSRSIMLTFPDNKPGDWYYIAIQEASNSHEYRRSVYETTGDEMWTKLIDNVDWTKLEK